MEINLTVKGPKGELHNQFDKEMTIEVEDNEIMLTRPTDTKNIVHTWYNSSFLANMIEGVRKVSRKN